MKIDPSIAALKASNDELAATRQLLKETVLDREAHRARLAEAEAALRRIADDPSVKSHPDSVRVARDALCSVCAEGESEWINKRLQRAQDADDRTL